MNKFTSLIFIFIFSILYYISGLAADPYKVIESNFNATSFKSYEVKNMPPIKSQDGLRNCFAQTSATMIEWYRCKYYNKCTSSSDDQRLSAIDLSRHQTKPASQFPDIDGGHPIDVLRNARSYSVVKEECLKTNEILYNENEDNDAYLYFLKDYFTREKRICGKRSLSDQEYNEMFITNLNHKFGEILAQVVKESNTMEAFLYNALITKKGCTSQTAHTPSNYEVNYYPKKEQPTPEKIIEMCKSLLLQDVPVSLLIEDHALVISGIKEACNKEGKCEILLKVVNSYGQSWQNQYDNGWLKASALINSSMKHTGPKLTWITPANYTPGVAQTMVESSQDTSSSMRFEDGIYRCQNADKTTYITNTPTDRTCTKLF